MGIQAAKGTTKVKSHYHFLTGLAGIGYGRWLAPGVASPEGAYWFQRLAIMRKNGPRRSRCLLKGPSELTQALRNFLTATKDNKPAIMPSSQIGLVGTGVATVGTGGTGGTGGTRVINSTGLEASPTV